MGERKSTSARVACRESEDLTRAFCVSFPPGPAKTSAMDDVECPPDLRFPVEITDISFHPTQDVVAVGLISGKVDM